MKYVPAFDGIRGVAILSVMLFHWKIPYCAGGYIGVDLFFVLSGYLITSILLAELETTGSISFRRFYARRALRLFPALALLVSVYLLLLPFTANKLERLQDALFVITYISDFTMAYLNRPKLLVHTWSLSVEEQFYLLWPVIFLALYKMRSNRKLVALVAVLAAFCTFDRLVLANPSRVYYSFDTRVDAILYGCLAAIWFAKRSVPWPTAAQLLGWFGLLAYFFSTSLRNEAGFYGYSFVALSALCLVVSANSSCWPQKIFSNRLLVWLGKRSYGLYLWHYPIMGFFSRDLHGWKLVSAVALTFAATEFSYRLVELPALGLKKVFAPKTEIACQSDAPLQALTETPPAWWRGSLM